MNIRKPGGSGKAFTLIELLVVIGIVAVIAAILFPVFAGIRERGRRTQCLSNERQLGMAVMQYAADNNETLFVAKGSPGLGWAGRCYPYVKSVSVFRCPDDATDDVSAGGDGSANGLAMNAVSYGFNSLLAGHLAVVSVPAIPPVTVGQIAGPDRTVLLFEVSDCVATLTGLEPDNYSAWGSMTLGSDFGMESDPTFPVGYSRPLA
jgi:prepilin-type N-terminal cleavage/methylation domain-containing protein